MDLQQGLTALLVALCAVYAAWTLAPAALRRALVRRLLTLPLPSAWRQRLATAARTPGGCAAGCGGCSQPAAAQPITVVRRRR